MKRDSNSCLSLWTNSVFFCHTSKRWWMTKKYIHGPVAAGDCLACHDPHVSSYKYLLWADSKIKLCLSCHTDKEKEFEEPGYKFHGIINGKGCVVCHSPHATDYPYQLYKPIQPLCGSCHPKFLKIKKDHPVAGHPVSGVKNPIKPQKMLNCASCHDPHGSKYEKLLIGRYGSAFCFKCHTY